MSEGPTLEWPSNFKRIRVDRQASAITYSIDDQKLPNDTEWLRDMRRQIARGIESTSSPSGAPLPIRFKIEVHGSSKFVALSECLLGIGWVYWGCPNHRVTATADITLDIDGKLYHGAGQGESAVHAIWYNQGEVTDSEMAAYLSIIEATRAALGSTEHAGLISNLERQVALLKHLEPPRRGTP